MERMVADYELTRYCINAAALVRWQLQTSLQARPPVMSATGRNMQKVRTTLYFCMKGEQSLRSGRRSVPPQA